MKALIAGLFAVALCGCVAVTATRTTTVAGNPVTETITVKSFLADITDGTYATTNGMVLSTSSTTPDQQSIATLANGVVSLATMFAAKAPTNTVNVLTNNTGNIVVTPAK
ncbi:MAG TPA: hypothetical protein VMQ76_08340 [Terracidiphilus sp.]|jgi:hypothetical protein|nr:hypothetical protein [Terracidiphilus sp.]